MQATRLIRALATAAILPLALLNGCASMSMGPPAPPTEVLMQPGISRTLAEHRARGLSAVEYHLRVDLTGTDSIPGEVVIFVEREPGSGDLVLDYRGLSVDLLEVNDRPADYRWENGHVLIPERQLHPGDNRVRVRFVSRMAPAGASVIRTETPAGGEEAGAAGDVYLYSLLVPADANQLFPSFDQPDLKAIFAFQAEVPAHWKVLSNAPPTEVVGSEKGARWRFAPTEPISTYLFAFAAGPWEIRHEAAPPPARDPMALFVRRSRADEADADTIIATNRRALEWLERYFGMEYPFSKFEMLLAPAFPFGGMEHPGAVFYNESRFIFREPPTLTERLGRAATIYHEVAHQWFGDLVTMKWFDDLWLKEGFSTYMAARMQEELNPGTGAWKTFYLRNKPLAYGIDATRGTTPVWQALENLDLAKSAYGPIVYNKAPAILKQLDYLVGEEAFREGLGILLEAHAYGNITWRDLLDALERSSGQSLDAFGEQYILRPGMPRVETDLRIDGGRIAALRLVQRPARELEGDPGGWWPGRVEVRLGYGGGEDVILPVSFSGDTTLVEAAEGLPAPDYVFSNNGDYGYGKFLLDPRSASVLAARVGALEDDLLRAMVWGALWDLVGEGRLAPDRYVELALRALTAEPDEQIAAAILRRVTTALERYVPAGAPEALDLQLQFESAMATRMNDTSLAYGQRKAGLDALLEGARTPAAQEILLELLGGERTFEGEPLKQPSRWTAVQTLLALEHPAADSLYTAERERDGSPESDRRAFVAGAAIPTAENKAEYFRRYLEDPDLNEEWVTASLGAFNHPLHASLTRPFLRPALEALPWIQENRRIFFLPQWVNSFIGGQHEEAGLAVVDAFLAENPGLPLDLRRKILQPRDALEEVVRVRAMMEMEGDG